MSRFDKRLREAMKRYAPDEPETAEIPSQLSERVDGLLKNAPSGKIDRILLTDQTGKEKPKMKRARIVLIAAALVVALTLAAVAAPMLVNYLNVRLLTETTGQKTTVPDGWIGIYNAAELDAVRYGLTGKYILMADIDLSGWDNWTPIGSREEPFKGAFDGNGFVVRNMSVVRGVKAGFTDGDYGPTAPYQYYLGLFGYVVCDPEPQTENAVWEDYPEYGGWELNGYIRNLGIENARITGVYDENCYGDQLYAGAVAARGEYILGCYVKNTVIDITVARDMKADYGVSNLNIGGIAGEAYLIDSCHTDAAITVRAEGDVGISCIAGIAGVASACVTSYFDGTIECGGLPDDRAVCFRENFPPKLLTKEVLGELIDRLNSDGGEHWYYIGEDGSHVEGEDLYDERLGKTILTMDAAKLDAFYAPRNPALSETLELVTSEPEGDYVWFFDPYAYPREYKFIAGLIAKAFDADPVTGERDSFVEYCRGHGLKYGVYYTYDLRYSPETSYEGFNFDTIWQMGENGRPVLRIFGNVEVPWKEQVMTGLTGKFTVTNASGDGLGSVEDPARFGGGWVFTLIRGGWGNLSAGNVPVLIDPETGKMQRFCTDRSCLHTNASGCACVYFSGLSSSGDGIFYGSRFVEQGEHMVIAEAVPAKGEVREVYRGENKGNEYHFVMVDAVTENAVFIRETYYAEASGGQAQCYRYLRYDRSTGEITLMAEGPFDGVEWLCPPTTEGEPSVTIYRGIGGELWAHTLSDYGCLESKVLYSAPDGMHWNGDYYTDKATGDLYVCIRSESTDPLRFEGYICRISPSGACERLALPTDRVYGFCLTDRYIYYSVFDPMFVGKGWNGQGAICINPYHEIYRVDRASLSSAEPVFDTGYEFMSPIWRVSGDCLYFDLYRLAGFGDTACFKHSGLVAAVNFVQGSVRWYDIDG